MIHRRCVSRYGGSENAGVRQVSDNGFDPTIIDATRNQVQGHDLIERQRCVTIVGRIEETTNESVP